jgi:uncharacterized RDD family membrane protein YckC
MAVLPIVTTQNVTINLELASVGKRILASFIDFIIKFAYIFLIYTLLSKAGFFDRFSMLDYWSIMALNILILLPAIFYSLILEIFWNGFTVGKKLTKIKVIKCDGYQASVLDYFTRWMFRIIDINVSFGILGILSMAVNKKGQRLGDITSGTAVINLTSDWRLNHTIFKEIKEDYVPVYKSILKLTDKDVRIIKNVLANYHSDRNLENINKLARKIESILGEVKVEKTDLLFIDSVLKDYNFYTKRM